MGFDVDWEHGASGTRADHLWSGHRVTIAEANEALTDVDARLYDPDLKSKFGKSARVIGYSPTAVAVLVVIHLVHREDAAEQVGHRGDPRVAEDLHAIEALASQLDVPVSALVRGWVLAGLNAGKAESVATALDRITADVQRLRELVA